MSAILSAYAYFKQPISDVLHYITLKVHTERLTEIELCDRIAGKIREPDGAKERFARAIRVARGVFRNHTGCGSLKPAGQVSLHHIVDISISNNPTALEQHCPVAKRLHGCHVVADEQDRPSLLAHLTHFPHAFSLKCHVPDS